MRPALPRLSLLCLTALLGPGCLVNPVDPPVVKNPCEPTNPCTSGDKTVCANNNGTAQCLCREGTVQRPNGTCEPVSAANCPEHPGDTAEPDDCLVRAAALSASTSPRQQSIEPVGDYDFFRIDATARDVHTLSVQPGTGSLLPRVDVFDQAGQWLASHDGRPQALVGFKARTTAPYYVRVSHSPVDPSAATGPYTLTLAAPVKDDHGDSSAETTSITARPGGTSPSVVNGRLEYGQDEDWFSFPTSTGQTRPLYRIDFVSGGGKILPTVAIYTGTTEATLQQTSRGAFIEFAADTPRFYLAVYSGSGQTGDYAFTVAEYR